MRNEPALNQPNLGQDFVREAPPSRQQTESSREKESGGPDELQRLRAEVAALRAEKAELTATLATVADERDVYHRELMSKMRQDVTFTEEQVQASIQNAVPIDGMLADS